MKINCEMTRDLLPLYEDGVCSDSSRAAVEAHLSQCESCRVLRAGIPVIPEPEIVLEVDGKQAARSFRKVRRRWRASLLAVVLALPLLMLTVNEIRGEGLCFTNADDIYVAQKFVKHLERGEYAQAAQLHDFTEVYQSILSSLDTPEEAYRRDFERIMVGDEVWYVRNPYIEDLPAQKDPRHFWLRFLFSDYAGVLFPEKVMKEIAEASPDSLTMQDGVYINANGINFVRTETPWGPYYTTEQFPIDMDTVTVIPEGVYLQILPEMLEKAAETYQRIQMQYGAVRLMGEAEFVAHMERIYAENLREVLEEKYTLTAGAVTRAHSVHVLSADLKQRERTGWQLETHVQVTSGGNSIGMELILVAKDGKVRNSGAVYTDGYRGDWLDDLMEALYAHYDDYGE